MKEKRINRVIKNIPNKFFNGEKEDKLSNIRTMKVQIDIDKIDQNMKDKLDCLLNNVDEKRKEILNELMDIFYNNPESLITRAGKIKEKKNEKTGEITYNYKFSKSIRNGYRETKTRKRKT